MRRLTKSLVYIFLKMQEEPEEDSQCLSDDTDTEISTQVSMVFFSHSML